MVKRYRYILCGLVSPDEPVTNFRLIAGNKIGTDVTSSKFVIRITIPEGIRLNKEECDLYSTWPDDDGKKGPPISELEATPLIRLHTGRWVKCPDGLWPKYKPCDISYGASMNFIHRTTDKKRLLELTQRQAQLNGG